MKILAYLLAVVATQAMAPLAVWWISEASYKSRSLSGSAEDWLSIITLLIGASGLVLGGRGVYLTILRIRPWLAAAFTTLVWTPLLLAAAVYGYAFLVFLSWA